MLKVYTHKLFLYKVYSFKSYYIISRWFIYNSKIDEAVITERSRILCCCCCFFIVVIVIFVLAVALFVFSFCHNFFGISVGVASSSMNCWSSLSLCYKYCLYACSCLFLLLSLLVFFLCSVVNSFCSLVSMLLGSNFLSLAHIDRV